MTHLEDRRGRCLVGRDAPRVRWPLEVLPDVAEPPLAALEGRAALHVEDERHPLHASNVWQRDVAVALAACLYIAANRRAIQSFRRARW